MTLEDLAHAQAHQAIERGYQNVRGELPQAVTAAGFTLKDLAYVSFHYDNLCEKLGLPGVPPPEKRHAPPERAARSAPPRPRDGHRAAAATTTAERIVSAPPGFPPDVYDLLPATLRRLLSFFDEGHERDVVLAAMLVVMAALMPNVWGRHRDGKYSPDTYLCILAKASDGKGIVKWALRLLRVVEKRLRDEYDAERTIYDETKRRYDEAKRKAKPTDTLPDPPGDEPAPRALSIEADISGSELKRSVARNGGRAFMAAQEIDTLSGANSREWGGFSDVLRSIYHHEPIGQQRVGDGRVSAEEPCLSLLLTGTPGQFDRLVPGVENGLFSRLSPYVFDAPIEWRDHRPAPRAADREEAFDAVAAALDERLYQALDGRVTTLWVDLTPGGWDTLNDYFRGVLNKRRNDPLLGAAQIRQDVVKRSCVAACRIAFCLAVVRAWDRGDDLAATSSILATEMDVEAALHIASTYLYHALALAGAMPQESALRIEAGPVRLLHALPATFTKSEATTTGEGLGIPERSVERYLTNLVERGHLRKRGQGQYAKVENGGGSGGSGGTLRLPWRPISVPPLVPPHGKSGGNSAHSGGNPHNDPEKADLAPLHRVGHEAVAEADRANQAGNGVSAIPPLPPPVYASGDGASDTLGGFVVGARVRLHDGQAGTVKVAALRRLMVCLDDGAERQVFDASSVTAEPAPLALLPRAQQKGGGMPYSTTTDAP